MSAILPAPFDAAPWLDASFGVPEAAERVRARLRLVLRPEQAESVRLASFERAASEPAEGRGGEQVTVDAHDLVAVRVALEQLPRHRHSLPATRPTPARRAAQGW